MFSNYFRGLLPLFFLSILKVSLSQAPPTLTQTVNANCQLELCLSCGHAPIFWNFSNPANVTIISSPYGGFWSGNSFHSSGSVAGSFCLVVELSGFTSLDIDYQSWGTCGPPGHVIDNVHIGPLTATSIPSKPTLSVSKNPVCPGENFTLSGTCSGGDVLKWYNNTGATGAPIFTGTPQVTSILSATTYYATCTSSSGCVSEVDSIVMNVSNNISDTIRATICEGSNIVFGGNSYTLPGIYSDTFALSGGCDSISNLELNVLPIKRDTIYDTICEGTPYIFAGNSLTTSGQFIDMLASANGCDSIVNLHLVVNIIDRDTLTVAICEGSTYTFGGNNINTTGLYHDTLLNGANCDSINTIDLTIHPIIRDSIDAIICNDEFYDLGGTLLNLTGVYSDTLLSVVNCDSIITVSLTVNDNQYDTVYGVVCNGETYSFLGNQYGVSGNFNDTVPTAEGCDSVITLVLTVNVSASTTLYDTICEGGSYLFGGNNFNTSGSYYDSLNTSLNCDSVVTLNLFVIPTKRDTINEEICFGDSVLFSGTYIKTDGIYAFNVTLANGCDSVSTLIIKVNPIPDVQIEGDVIYCKNELGTLRVDDIFTSYLWTTNEVTPSISFFSGGLYKVIVSDENFCQNTDSVTVSFVNCNDTCDIFLPNTFTPNGDGTNDVFLGEANPECIFLSYKLLIFNRWGQLIFETEDLNKTWDGTYLGNKAQIDTYVWVLEYRKQGEVTSNKKIGHVNIIK